jgi:hypothetical protein
VLLQADHVEALLPVDAAGAALVRLHAKDCHGRTWELLVRHWEPPGEQPQLHARLRMLEQAAGFLKDRGAKPGDMLVLSRMRDSPLRMEVCQPCTAETSTICLP